MKKLSNVLIALIMCITLAGCSSKRETLFDDQVIEHMKEKDMN